MHPALATIDEPTLARICRRHGIRRLSLFGSQLKGSARPDSDVDLLVEFEPGRTSCLLGGRKLVREVILTFAKVHPPEGGA